MIPDINLLPKQEKDRSGSPLLYALLGVLVLLVLSLLAWQYFSARADVISLEAEESSLITKRDELQSQLDSYTSTEGGSLEQSVTFVENVSYPVSPLIDETQRLQPSNSYLRDYSFDAASVTITVDFETLNELSKYISRLNNSSYFLDVQVTSISNYDLTANETEEEDFTVLPRQSAEIVLLIDHVNLAIGGMQ